MFQTKEIPSKSIEVIDEGLRQYMLKVFNYMGMGLCITALSAYIIANTSLLFYMLKINSAGQITGLSAIGWIVTFAPLFLIFQFYSALRNGSYATVQILFWTYSALVGASLGTILIAYTASSITRVFLITAAMFGTMSLIGYTTKRDLTAFRSFLMMGLVGVIIASIVNIFMNSSGMYYMLSYVSVVLFTGFTAYDIQKIKGMYIAGDNEEMSSRKAISGALALYLDFLNLFIALIRIMGDRK